MDEHTAKAVRDDFLIWSGGFSPDSDDQITVYVDYAASGALPNEEVRQVLRQWTEEESRTP